MVCQCPRRAILISTEKCRNCIESGDFWCQCPRRAILISTVVALLLSVGSHLCVNALGGLFSFLLKKLWKRRQHLQKVSMPSAGYSHFYKTNSSNLESLVGCQCPRRAILISTQMKFKVKDSAIMCQCPRRAILISTRF